MAIRTTGLFALFLCAVQAVPAATIYTCEKDGRKVFSQVPCGADATILQTNDAYSVAIESPMKQRDIEHLCRLVMRAREISEAATTAADINRRADYLGDGNDPYPRSRHVQSQERPPSSKDFVLSHISNLSEIARQSPTTYEMLRNLHYDGYYSRDDDRPIHDAERAASMTRCESRLRDEMNGE